MIFIGLAVKMAIMAELALQLKKGTPHSYIDLPPLNSTEVTGVCIPIGNTQMLLAVVYRFLKRVWYDTNITEVLGFRNKSIIAGDLNSKHSLE
jgi:hypothetical protein